MNKTVEEKEEAINPALTELIHKIQDRPIFPLTWVEEELLREARVRLGERIINAVLNPI